MTTAMSDYTDLARSDEKKMAAPMYHNPEVAEGKTPHGRAVTELDPSETDDDGVEYPTEEELKTLQRVSGNVPWSAYTIAFVELCERFGYYGCSVIYVNFIQRPLPPGQPTGAGHSGQSGALDMGQRASFGLTTFNSFWAYCTPLLGAYIADQYLGRFKTIFWAIGIAILGHIVLIAAATPKVIETPNTALGLFSFGLILLGLGTGCFKANISPLIAEQYTETRLKIVTSKSGERQISDPTITLSRIFLYFYLMVNVGSLTGQISMVYVEKYVGFWCAFLLPTIMFCFCPIVLFLCRNKYRKSPPTYSVISKAFKLWMLASKGRWSLNPMTTRKRMSEDSFWENVKPSHLGAAKPGWMSVIDDAWVDQVARGFAACTVFLWYPLYWLAYNQMTNNLTSQAATMTLNGVPNDVINNLNPISLIIFIPLVDKFFYPSLRKMGIQFTPLKRMFTGFLMASIAMVSACVIQHYIYKLGKCHEHMNTCVDEKGNQIEAPINVWVQTIPYVLIGFSEIFASVTGLEYAFTKAPKNMRSLVTAFFHFQSALGSAVGQALVSLADDPLLVWNYLTAALLALVGGIAFWACHHNLDKKEDALNMLADSEFVGKSGGADPEAQKK